MKGITIKLLSLLFFVPFVISSCSDVEPSPFDNFDEKVILNEAEADQFFEDIDAAAAEGILIQNLDGLKTKEGRFFIPDCAEILLDEEAKRLSIDFGTGCLGRRGSILTGKIIVEYTQPGFIPGSIITTTLENYRVDGNLVEGTRVVKNISESIFANQVYEITLTNGKVSFKDATSITRDVTSVREWVRNSDSFEDIFLIKKNSEASGINRKGEEYKSVVTEDLIYTVRCALEKGFLPVYGLKEITIDGRLFTINFGGGECDNTVIVESDGVQKIIDFTTFERQDPEI